MKTDQNIVAKIKKPPKAKRTKPKKIFVATPIKVPNNGKLCIIKRGSVSGWNFEKPIFGRIANTQRFVKGNSVQFVTYKTVLPENFNYFHSYGRAYKEDITILHTLKKGMYAYYLGDNKRYSGKMGVIKKTIKITPKCKVLLEIKDTEIKCNINDIELANNLIIGSNRDGTEEVIRILPTETESIEDLRLINSPYSNSDETQNIDESILSREFIQRALDDLREARERRNRNTISALKDNE